MTGKDFLDATGVKIGELDILDGSPPCSAFSVAGKLSHNVHEEEHVDLWGNVTIEKVAGKHSDGWGQTKNYSDGKSLSGKAKGVLRANTVDGPTMDFAFGVDAGM